MKSLYTHRVVNLRGDVYETVLDMSKVVAINRSAASTLIKVHCAGLKAPLDLIDMPAVVAETTEAFSALTEENFNALIKAWDAARS